MLRERCKSWAMGGANVHLLLPQHLRPTGKTWLLYLRALDAYLAMTNSTYFSSLFHVTCSHGGCDTKVASDATRR